VIIDADGSAHITDDTGECWCNPSIITVEAKEPGMISDEAVEAAARTLLALSTHGFPWGDLIPEAQARYKAEARAALEAAAPYMLAPAKAEGWRVGYEQGWKDGGDSERTGEDYGPHRTNPYRSQA